MRDEEANQTKNNILILRPKINKPGAKTPPLSPENRKYYFTGRSKKIDGVAVWQIRSRTLGNYGGFIESEDNLSFWGEAWVCAAGAVLGGARVYGDAWIRGGIITGGKISGHAEIEGGRVQGGIISGGAIISGGLMEDGEMSGNALLVNGLVAGGYIGDEATVCGGRVLGGVICGTTVVSGSATMEAGCFSQGTYHSGVNRGE
ncbi:MAG: hypothetical protein CL504_08535 [Actinobacteria bacterium]|nr:hypothetical protein [Actinomycetota bacterium]